MNTTLHALSEIFGISCVGRPVRLEEDEVASDSIKCHLSQCEVGACYQLKDLIDKFSDPCAMTTDKHATVYLTYLLWITLFVDKTHSNVPQAYLPLFNNMTIVPAYAWARPLLSIHTTS
ncbi:hypothetical protein LIER_35006 [Lithospermum erythrorhizon]|uniref:Aminotransferase-like plant mobile domain-containing protein n=1 Tax=Lithospermum erythrorhizon TaxID=34254 RepID=A0AAV3NMH8_LITER